MQYDMLHPMGKVFYLSQLAADQKELVSDKICDITLHTNEKPGVEDAYQMPGPKSENYNFSLLDWVYKAK